MARVQIENNQLIISMKGTRKLTTLTSELVISLDNVKKALVSTDDWDETIPNIGQRRVGSNIPGWYYGGIFVQEGDKVFYDLKRGEGAVVLELKDEEDFSRIIIGVEDPAATVEYIEKALK